MKKCSQCGAENQDSAKFCGMCRATLKKAAAPTPTKAPFKLTKLHIGIATGLVIAGGIIYAALQPNRFNPATATNLSADALDKRGADAFANKDYTTAIGWYGLAAAKGDAVGENFMGWFCQYGLGTKQDGDAAFGWYSKAAAQGNTSAETNLGWCYQNEIGVAKNLATAIQLYQKAIQGNNDSAEINMGYLYENGIGVEKDLNIAKQWYQKALSQGNQEAKNDLDLLEAKQVDLKAVLNKGIVGQ